jgi:hypothetical protein
MDEVAAATASITEAVDDDNVIDTITLEHCAEQILSGIKREVEVQYLVPMVVSSNGELMNNQQCHQNEQTDQHCPVKETGTFLHSLFVCVCVCIFIQAEHLDKSMAKWSVNTS